MELDARVFLTLLKVLSLSKVELQSTEIGALSVMENPFRCGRRTTFLG